MLVIKKDGHEITILPERGGIISAWVYRGEQIFYEDSDVLHTPIIRGGMPVLFPLCGELQDNMFYYNGSSFEMKRHGFARDCQWEVIEHTTRGVTLQLRATAKTLACFPFLFQLTVNYEISENGLTVNSQVLNIDNKPMPYQLGFHPYFYTLAKHLSCLEADWEREVTQILPYKKPFILQTPLFKMALNVSKGFDHIVVWSLPDKPFLCIEPWHGDVASVQSAKSTILKPGESHTYQFCLEIRLAEEIEYM